MTNNRHTSAPEVVPAHGSETPTALEDLDLTPDGLADTPAHQMDLESLVHTGNS